MRKLAMSSAALAAALALAGCVSAPLGPTVPVMPGKNKSFAQFQADQDYCEGYANDRVAGRVNAANDQIARNTVLGAALGAILGGAIGGDTRGAVVGGAAGAAVGASTAHPDYRQYSTQEQYNIAFAQCMKYRGNEIAEPYGPRRPQPRYRDYPPPPPPPGDYPPPPPPGDYPPPD